MEKQKKDLLLDWLSDVTNRSYSQTEYLYEGYSGPKKKKK